MRNRLSWLCLTQTKCESTCQTLRFIFSQRRQRKFHTHCVHFDTVTIMWGKCHCSRSHCRMNGDTYEQFLSPRRCSLACFCTCYSNSRIVSVYESSITLNWAAITSSSHVLACHRSFPSCSTLPDDHRHLSQVITVNCHRAWSVRYSEFQEITKAAHYKCILFCK